MDEAYKKRKIDFVSDLTGGTSLEIVTVVLVPSTAILLWSALQSRQRFFSTYSPAVTAVEFVLNCAAFLLAITEYSSIPLLLNGILLLPAIVAYGSSALASHTRTKGPKAKKDASKKAKDPLPIKPFVTNYRGSMMIITCISILAVDFAIFPRRFAKVENWGTSLMDVGVGSFVFSAGVVGARPLLKSQIDPSKRTSLISRLIAATRHSIPLLVLGLIRLYSVKGLDYAEHVTEYGVHWNFFFTLGFLPPFVAFFESALEYLPSPAILAILLGVMYEAALDFTDLTSYIVKAPRVDLISKNREGIFSFAGYLSIFLAGQAMGMTTLKRSQASPWSIHSTLGRLVQWTGFWILLYVATTNHYGLGLNVSRRLANFPYQLWIAAFNGGQLMMLCAIEQLCFPDLYSASDAETEKKKCSGATSWTLRAFNRNGLAIFLVANLLTGLVNLTLPTLDMQPMPSLAVLMAYTAALSSVALGLDHLGVSIKL